MRQNLTIIMLLVLIVMLPLTTSWLLDWTFISRETSRQVIVYFLMLLEVVILFIVGIDYLKKL